MTPPVALPREHQPVARAPIKLLLGNNGVEHAAGTGVGFPNLPAGPIGNAGHVDGPRLACPPAGRSAAGARVSVALPGDIVKVAASGLTIGIPYFVGATAGSLAPLADLVTGNKVTFAGISISASSIHFRLYSAAGSGNCSLTNLRKLGQTAL